MGYISRVDEDGISSNFNRASTIIFPNTNDSDHSNLLGSTNDNDPRQFGILSPIMNWFNDFSQCYAPSTKTSSLVDKDMRVYFISSPVASSLFEHVKTMHRSARAPGLDNLTTNPSREFSFDPNGIIMLPIFLGYIVTKIPLVVVSDLTAGLISRLNHCVGSWSDVKNSYEKDKFVGILHAMNYGFTQLINLLQIGLDILVKVIPHVFGMVLLATLYSLLIAGIVTAIVALTAASPVILPLLITPAILIGLGTTGAIGTSIGVISLAHTIRRVAQYIKTPSKRGLEIDIDNINKEFNSNTRVEEKEEKFRECEFFLQKKLSAINKKILSPKLFLKKRFLSSLHDDLTMSIRSPSDFYKKGSRLAEDRMELIDLSVDDIFLRVMSYKPDISRNHDIVRFAHFTRLCAERERLLNLPEDDEQLMHLTFELLGSDEELVEIILNIQSPKMDRYKKEFDSLSDRLSIDKKNANVLDKIHEYNHTYPRTLIASCSDPVVERFLKHGLFIPVKTELDLENLKTERLRSCPLTYEQVLLLLETFKQNNQLWRGMTRSEEPRAREA